MRDRTRRSLVVLLFLAFGPTLTAALVGWVILRRSSPAVQYETYVIQAGTGMDLRIDSVEYLRWNFWKYGQVKLPHPSTGQPFVIFSDLENRLIPQKVSRSGSLFSFVLPEGLGAKSVWRLNSPSVLVTLNSKTDLAILSDLLLNQFGDRFADRKPNLAFHFDEVEVRCPEFHFILTFVEGRFCFEEGEYSLECRFNFQENPSQEPILFTIVRQKNNSSEDSEFRVELRTEETRVPVRFLALLFPGLKLLGPEAFFHGTVRGELSKRNSWVITFEDMGIGNADLKTFGAELTPYRLSGQVQMGILSARMAFSDNQSRFLDAKGWILAENGSIERKLLAQLVEDWQLSPNPNNENNPLYQNNPNYLEKLQPERQDALFVKASFFVLLGKDGIMIRQGLDEESGLVMIMDQDGFYKYYLPERISKSRISYLALLRSFSPDDTKLFPLTPQILRILPNFFQTP